MKRALWLGLLTLAACESPTEPEPEIGQIEKALGEPVDGFPNWYERVVQVWSNRARADPAADLANCGSCAEAACYSPAPPMLWNQNLGRAARFHSSNLVLGGCGLQHDSPCTVVSDIGTQYIPGPCDGSPSCACENGTFSCGSVGTTWSSRVAAFGTSPNSENIARGYTDPISTFYLWLHEPTNDSSCGFSLQNGHRYNILTASRRSIGVGKWSSTYTQDFSGSGTPSGVVSGVHYPMTGSSIDFRANWYAAEGPSTAMVNIDGVCHPMSLERGTMTNGTFLANVTGLSGCVRYYFEFSDSTGDHWFPTTGSFGIGCTNDWEAARAAPCGNCVPDCTGRACGNNGCGGSCGTCPGAEVCDDPSGTCSCPVSADVCGGNCVDILTDPNNCGACGTICAANEACQNGGCVCIPDCSGKSCGPDGCGGSCGSCAADRTCDANGICQCTAPLTNCSGTCIDTANDDQNCGTCGNRCRGNEYCAIGMCFNNNTPPPDGGVISDSGVADSGTIFPDASTPDATTTPDSGSAPDATTTPDSGSAPDATTTPDSGGAPDAASAPDSGFTDAQASSDAGTGGADATAAVDSGASTSDGGELDAGATGSDGGTAGSDAGPGADAEAGDAELPTTGDGGAVALEDAAMVEDAGLAPQADAGSTSPDTGAVSSDAEPSSDLDGSATPPAADGSVELDELGAGCECGTTGETSRGVPVGLWLLVLGLALRRRS